MYAIGAGGECDIDPLVYQYFRAVRVTERENPADEVQQVPRRQVFFAYLHPLDAGIQRAIDVCHERVNTTERLAIGYVVAEH
jgi:hypothetical protein